MSDNQSQHDPQVVMETNDLLMKDTIDDNENEQFVKPDVSDADYFFYVADLDAVRESWTDDRAFYPSTITYGLAFVVGLTGNILVVAALLSDRKARNVTSSFMVSLAVADLVTSSFMVSLAVADLVFLLVCVPYEAANKFFTYWSGGLALCKLTGYVEMLSALASVFNLTAVSVERYVVIVYPMKSRYWHTARTTYKIIAVVWIMALLLSSPTLYIMDTTVYVWHNNLSSVTIMNCVDNNVVSDVDRIAFAWYQLFVMFMFPVVVILYCYAVVIRVLWKSTKELAMMTSSRIPASTTTATRREQQRSDLSQCQDDSRHHGNQAATNRAAVTSHAGDVGETRKQLLLNLLPYIQSCCNPVIYSFMSTRFRQSISATCSCCPVACRQADRHGDVIVAADASNQQLPLWPMRNAITNRTSIG